MLTKKRFRSAICLTLLLSLVAVCTACGAQSASETPTADLVASVILCDEEKDAELEYYAVYDSGDAVETDAFTADDANYYTADTGCFSSYIDDDNVVRNILETVSLTDGEGNAVGEDDTLTTLMQAVADTVTHEIWTCTLIEDNGQYFAFVKLNVNLQSPCDLYAYDEQTQTLTLLGEWNGVDLIGIAV
ncbi:MAG: hypothetical protein LUD84_04430 [Clostridiales bacterium]|nr:hypothetical protein [Clostridiales bacterium]